LPYIRTGDASRRASDGVVNWPSSTNLRWYAFAFVLFYNENDIDTLVPSLSWAFVSKKDERKIGADFGIVARTPGEGTDTIRFVLIQTKRERKSRVFSASYLLHGKNDDDRGPVEKLRYAMESKQLGAMIPLLVLQLHGFVAFEDQFRTDDNKRRYGSF
jgi:hypothetical protein